MVAIKKIRRTLNDWDQRALGVEAKLLERELEHLSKKQSQRRLSYWEEARLRQIPSDLSQIQRSDAEPSEA